MTHQDEADALKKAAASIGTTAVLAYLLTVAPWTRLPILSSIIKWIVQYVVNTAIKETELGLFFLFIDVRTSSEGRDFQSKAIKNREVQVNGTADDKAKSEAALIDSFRALVRLTN